MHNPDRIAYRRRMYFFVVVLPTSLRMWLFQSSVEREASCAMSLLSLW
ncbi:MAG: hypothetical protein V7606_2422 [Burkholderiales bacterium]|jgi:hypothetical protein